MHSIEILLFSMLISSFIAPNDDFKKEQLRHVRVKNAYEEKEHLLKDLLEEKGIAQPYSLFIQAFKKENTLQIWLKGKDESSYQLFKEYPFCKRPVLGNDSGIASGTLGPKRKEGDRQIPEGVYHISHFNPVSNFHLSLGINYPNKSDQLLGDPKTPGGDIYIHGDCVTIGCIPITDDKIKELYILAVEAKDVGQDKIPVYIFPTKLNRENLNRLKSRYKDKPETIRLWEELSVVYQHFVKNKTLPDVRIDSKGRYKID